MWKKYGTVRQATDGNTMTKGRMRIACWITKATLMRVYQEIIPFRAPKNLHKSQEHFFGNFIFPCQFSNPVHL